MENLRAIFKLFGPKCPKCESRDIVVLKESFVDALFRNLYNFMFLPRLLFQEYRSAPKKLFVCRNCAFEWEKR